jgi:hypothetical protein
MSNFVKIRPLASELFRVDGRTDRQTDITKLIVACRNFFERAERLQCHQQMYREVRTVRLGSFSRSDYGFINRSINLRELSGNKCVSRLGTKLLHLVNNNSVSRLGTKLLHLVNNKCFSRLGRKLLHLVNNNSVSRLVTKLLHLVNNNSVSRLNTKRNNSIFL